MGENCDLYATPHANRRLQSARVDRSKISLPPMPQLFQEHPLPPPDITDDDLGPSDTSVAGTDALTSEKLKRAEGAFSAYVTKRHTQLSLPILQVMCKARKLDDAGTRADLFARLSDWVRVITLLYVVIIDPAFQRELHVPHPPEEQDLDLEPGAVLGKNILESVWQDMTLTQLPSWMSPAPKNWGTAARGKLKADQWKVIATVHLPITLMRLWGRNTDRYFLLLCNFMDLNAAVQLANQRVITADHIRDYEALLLRYLRGMMVLFKDTGLQPVHHVSLHTADFLRLFGPTHSVRTQGFERFNEMLGSQNINMKSGASPLFIHSSKALMFAPGELELTFTMSACRAANLEALMDDGSIQTTATELVNAFTTVANEDHRGTRLADEIHFPQTKPPTHTRLDSRTFNLFTQLVTHTTGGPGAWNLVTPEVLELGKITISGVIYASHKTLPRDSNIMFRRPGRASHCIGRVDLIFQPRDGRTSDATFLAVSQFSPVHDHAMNGVYGRFGFTGGYLYTEGHVTPRVIQTSDVICHFAKTPVESEGQGLMHALPLNMVFSSMPIYSHLLQFQLTFP